METIAFLGAGNMASAMVQGLIAEDAGAAARLACMGGAGATAAALAAKSGIRLATSLDDLLRHLNAVADGKPCGAAMEAHRESFRRTFLKPLSADILAGRRAASEASMAF